MWATDQLRPLLECSVLTVRSVELLHQIEQAGEHSWATAPTIVLLQAGIQDTASPPPLRQRKWVSNRHTTSVRQGNPFSVVIGPASKATR